MTCLLDVEQVGRFVGVKGVDDVLAGVEPYGGVYGDSAVDGVFGPFRVPPVVPE